MSSSMSRFLITLTDSCTQIVGQVPGMVAWTDLDLGSVQMIVIGFPRTKNKYITSKNN